MKRRMALGGIIGCGERRFSRGLEGIVDGATSLPIFGIDFVGVWKGVPAFLCSEVRHCLLLSLMHMSVIGVVRRFLRGQ